MAQVTGVESFVDCIVEISTDGSTWPDVSGFANSVTVEGFERMSGEEYTFDGEFAIIGVGKAAPGSVTVRVAYTDTADDPFDKAYTAYEGKSRLQVRYWPAGKGVGAFGFYTDADSKVLTPPIPAGAADQAEPIFVEFTTRSRRLLRTTAT